MSLSDRLRRITRMTFATLGMNSMITCQEALAVMQEFLDGELSRKDGDRVRAHFEVCAGCYPRLRVEKSFRSAVKMAAGGQSAPAHLEARLRTLLDQAARG